MRIRTSTCLISLPVRDPDPALTIYAYLLKIIFKSVHCYKINASPVPTVPVLAIYWSGVNMFPRTKNKSAETCILLRPILTVFPHWSDSDLVQHVRYLSDSQHGLQLHVLYYRWSKECWNAWFMKRESFFSSPFTPLMPALKPIRTKQQVINTIFFK
jgi:hypothetical protein